MKEDKDKYL